MNRVFIIGGRSYNISDPTIEKLSLAGKEFEEVPENDKYKLDNIERKVQNL